MASALISAALNSDSDGNAFTDADTKEEEEEGEADWVNTPYFLVEHVLEEYKSQSR